MSEQQPSTPDAKAFFATLAAGFFAAAADAGFHDRAAVALTMLEAPYLLTTGQLPSLLICHYFLGLTPEQTGFTSWEAVRAHAEGALFGRPGV